MPVKPNVAKEEGKQVCTQQEGGWSESVYQKHGRATNVSWSKAV